MIEIMALYFILLPVLVVLVIGGYCSDYIEDKCKKPSTKIKMDYK